MMRARSRGFTLVELMVSLVAGLIVTIAVVGLARAATTTFFEAARISSVESTVRTASERLRQDLARASYMSTGNIRLAVDQAGGVPLSQRIGVNDPTAPGPFGGSRYTTLDNLAGIHITVGGSGNQSIGPLAVTNPLSANMGLNPDAIELSGNYTTDDSYQGTFSVAGGTGPGGQSVTLTLAADAAVRRLMNPANPLASAQAAFLPVPGRLFAARVIDGKGCQHYVVVSNVTVGVGTVTISIDQDKGGGPAVMVNGPTNHSNCGSTDLEQVTINPVHRVRWYMGLETTAALAPTLGVQDVGKFNIYREFLDAAVPPVPIPQMRQVVAEYAVDLKFGITVADAANLLQVYEMDTDPGGGAGNIDRYTALASTTFAGQPGPQRVRSVRFRVATRSAIPDRNANLAVPPGPPYLSRYCTDGNPLAGCRFFARVRTVVSEVALMNQMGMTY